MHGATKIGARLARIFDLSGKVAVVTGSAQGLGRATAGLLCEVGASVVIADLDVAKARATAEALESDGGVALPVAVDLADPASIQALFAAVDRRYGRVDILVNNAANRAKAELFDMTIEQWDAMLDVTLRGTFLCCREAIARMQRQKGGSIVNISSAGAAHTTIWGANAHYDAAKAGVDSLTRSFAGEFGADGIRVNSVLPGGMASEGGKSISSQYRIRGPMAGPGRIPLNRMADPLEVAQLVLFLASPASGYITGQTIAADGGFMVA